MRSRSDLPRAADAILECGELLDADRPARMHAPGGDADLGACLIAMKRLALDRVWWLVTPGNPLKNTQGLAPLADRVLAAKILARHPRIDVTGVEAQIGTRYTYETVAYLRRH